MECVHTIATHAQQAAGKRINAGMRQVGCSKAIWTQWHRPRMVPCIWRSDSVCHHHPLLIALPKCTKALRTLKKCKAMSRLLKTPAGSLTEPSNPLHISALMFHAVCRLQTALSGISSKASAAAGREAQQRRCRDPPVPADPAQLPGSPAAQGCPGQGQRNLHRCHLSLVIPIQGSVTCRLPLMQAQKRCRP